jgi:signal peptidase I
MSDAPMGDAARRASPFLSIWSRPRQAIDDILASDAGRLVLPISALGGAATAVSWLLSVGLDRALFDWRVLLACFVGGGALSIVNVYVTAFVAGWLARRMGGTATTASLRAVIAWGMLPFIAAAGLALAVIAGVRIAGGGATASLRNGIEIVLSVCALWSVVITMLMLARVARFGFWRTIVTYGIAALVVPELIALLIRTFLFQPFNIPSMSVSPTLLRGDYVFATKFAYGYSRYSLPFAQPSFSGRLFAAEPARGDIVVFRLPKDGADYVKRVVGLPGDRIQMKNGELLINGVPVKREALDDYVGRDLCGSGEASVTRWRETLPNGTRYETLDCVDNGFYDNTNVFTVPSGHLFVLGDNRDNSSDSRVLSVMGYVPMDNLIGRVDMIFFSRAGGEDGEPSRIRYERIGKMVR